MIDSLRKDLKKLSDNKKAASLSRYFKTGKGEYGDGDIFLGLSALQSRELAIKHKDLSYPEIETLLKSPVHEERLIALLILVNRFESEEMEQRRVYDFYLRHAKLVNNWDLVDMSSDKIVGGYLEDKPRDILYKLAISKNIWERRIAMVSCFAFIKEKDFVDSLKVAEILLSDQQDLIQKAVGWMLREVGKRDEKCLKNFLSQYSKEMSRTSLRYATEKFPESVRAKYLQA
jgi:3-methyladenine DNA glycosylase AlkD